MILNRILIVAVCVVLASACTFASSESDLSCKDSLKLAVVISTLSMERSGSAFGRQREPLQILYNHQLDLIRAGKAACNGDSSALSVLSELEDATQSLIRILDTP